MTIGTRARAEAAAWLARLQSEARDPIDEAGFREWLAQEDAHRQAFDNVTTAWEIAGGVAAGYAPPPVVPRRIGRKILFGAVAACLVAVAGFLAVQTKLAPSESQAYATGPGDSLSISLSGGSTVSLGADSRLSVTRKPGGAAFVLQSGEARFNISSRPLDPSVSSIVFGKREIQARKAVVDVGQRGQRAFAELLSGQARISIRGTDPLVARDMLTGERAIFRADPTP